MKKIFLFLSLLIINYGILFAEEITITTYYPSPFGSYNELTANQMKIGAAYSAAATAFEPNGLLVEGDVGIGTSNPSGSLEVAGGIRAVTGLPTSANTSDVGYSFGPDGDTGVFRTGGINPFTSGDLAFVMDSQERVRISGAPATAGNVGIGITAPVLRLDVRGNSTKTTTAALGNIFQVASSDVVNPLALRLGIKTDTNVANRYAALDVNDAGVKRALILQPSGGGYVGIGTTMPVASLDIMSSAGNIGGYGILHVGGNTNPVTNLSQGAYIGWNALSGGSGETNFINNDGPATDINSAGGFVFMNIDNGPSTARKTLMRILGNGTVGIGTIDTRAIVANDRYRLAVNGKGYFRNNESALAPPSYWPTEQDYSLRLDSSGLNMDNDLRFAKGGEDFAAIQVRGELMGVNRNSFDFFVKNPFWTNPLSIRNSGVIVVRSSIVNEAATCSVNWSCPSDIRFKKDINTIPDALKKVLSLRGVNFLWKDESIMLSKSKQLGLIAQEVEKVIPEVVREQDRTGDEKFKIVDYDKLVPLLIEGIKEQQKQIDSLKEQIKELKIKIQ